jgi:rod shape-determining protein MreD
MIYKIGINILAVAIIFVFQVSFLNSLPYFWGRGNLPLISIIFILAAFNFRTALWWALGFGLLLDVYSFGFFGVNVLSLLLVLAVIAYLLNNFFTNRSFYSFLVLVFFANLAFNFSYDILSLFWRLFSGGFIGSAWENMREIFLKELAADLLFTSAIFLIINSFSKRLKPEFIRKNK